MSRWRLVVFVALATAMSGLSGCAIMHLFGGMAQNFEYQKLIEVHPAYSGLENKRVAIVVNCDYDVLYQHADLPMMISANIASRVQLFVPGAQVVSPADVSNWQFQTAGWNAMPFGEVATALGAERVILVDLNEFRLNPRGNQWLWEGYMAADIQVIEADAVDPDIFADSFHIEASFPSIRGVSVDQATAGQIKTGLLKIFVDRSAWLFYRHLEPKYPDKYDGPAPSTRDHELFEE